MDVDNEYSCSMNVHYHGREKSEVEKWGFYETAKNLRRKGV